MRKPTEIKLSTVLGIGQILTWGMTYYLPAILFAPVQSDLGWEKIYVVYAFTLSLIVSGICAPFVGRAVVRYSGKRVLLVGCALNVVGLITLGSTSVYGVFLFAWGVIGVGMSATLYIIAFSTLTEALGAKARKSISTITLWGGLASTLAWPFGAYFVDHFGWRYLCFLYAGIFLVVLLPMYQFGLVTRQKTLPAQGTPAQQDTLEARAPGTLFRYLTGSIMLFSYISGTLSLFLIIILVEDGSTVTMAAGIAAFMGPSQIAARVVDRLIAGRINALWILLAANLLLLCGVAMIMAGGPVVLVGVVIFGTGKGLISIAKGSVALQVFGPDNYAVRIGRMERYVLFTQAAAPIISGWVFAVSGAFGLLGLLLGCAVVALPLCLKLLRKMP